MSSARSIKPLSSTLGDSFKQLQNIKTKTYTNPYQNFYIPSLLLEKNKKHIAPSGKSLFILLLIFTMSCEEPIELDLDGTETTLVLNCHFSPDETFEVFISKSISPYSEEFEFEEYPNDALVQIYKGNEVLETLWPINGQLTYPFLSYQSVNVKPEVGVAYTVRAKLDDFERVNATSVIPEPVTINDVGIINIRKEYPKMIGATSTIDSTVIDYVFDLSVKLEGVINLPAYYHLDVYYERVSYTVESSDTIRSYSGDFDSVELEHEEGVVDGLKHYDKGILIKQEASKNVAYIFKTRTRNPIDSKQDIFDRLYVDLRTVSKDYFLYHTKLTRQYEYDGDVLNDPVLLHNNVNNGYGIFAGYGLSRDSVFVHPK